MKPCPAPLGVTIGWITWNFRQTDHSKGGMTKTLRQQVTQFKAGKQGHRFRDHYARQRQMKDRTSSWSRILVWLIALVLLAIGIVLVFIPGPAVVFFCIAGALLATESHPIAVAMDWCEVKIRAVLSWVRCS